MSGQPWDDAVQALANFRECLTDPYDFDLAIADLRAVLGASEPDQNAIAGTCLTCGRDLVQTPERTYHPAAVLPPGAVCDALLPIAGTTHLSLDVPAGQFFTNPTERA